MQPILRTSLSALVGVFSVVILAGCGPMERRTTSEVTATSPAGNDEQTGTFVVEGEAVGECGLSRSFIHDTREGRRRVLHEGGALAFRSAYAVNTDGAPNSYHPNDPWGNAGLAINTICNGANVTTPGGERVDYRQCRRLVENFVAARDGGWTPPNGPRVEFYGVARRGDRGDDRFRPCIRDDGFFVSTTSIAAQPSADRCEQRRYLNALDTNFIIRPGARAFAGAGMALHGLAVVHHPRSGRTAYAIVGDTGPATGLGEGSVALNLALRGETTLPTSRAEVNRMGLSDVVTIVLPNARLDGAIDQGRIDRAAAAAFEEFGGPERLRACVAVLASR